MGLLPFPLANLTLSSCTGYLRKSPEIFMCWPSPGQQRCVVWPLFLPHSSCQSRQTGNLLPSTGQLTNFTLLSWICVQMRKPLGLIRKRLCLDPIIHTKQAMITIIFHVWMNMWWICRFTFLIAISHIILCQINWINLPRFCVLKLWFLHAKNKLND